MPDHVVGERGKYVLDAASRREGGQAEVFRAIAPDGRPIAVRMPRHPNDTDWFARECGAIDDLTQRLADARGWIVAIVDRGVAPDGRPFAVMPWYPMNLTEWLRTGPPLERRLEALGQACRAVARLHQGGAGELDLLVHRDLKPSNLLIREDENGLSVVLTDLGAARAGALLATVPNTLIYTRSYAPPEQQLPVQLAPDPTVDVHALGVTVYFGLAGRIPTAVLGREALRTADAQRLLTLDALGATRSAAEEAEYRALAHRPLVSLLDFADARPLFPGDEAVLRSKLADQLVGRCDDPEVVADRIAAKVIPALHRALEPNPARRLGDARILQAACHHAVRLLRQEGVIVNLPALAGAPASEPPEPAVPATPVPVMESSEVPLLTDGSLPPAPAASPVPARWAALAGLAGLAGILGAVALVVVLGSRGEADPPESAAAPVDVPAADIAAAPTPETPPSASPAARLGKTVVAPGGHGPDVGPPAVSEVSAPVRSPARPGPAPAAPRATRGEGAADVAEEAAPARPPHPISPPTVEATPAAATPDPPKMVLQCPSERTVKLDGHTATSTERLSEGTHSLQFWEMDAILARSSLTVRRDGGGWIVQGPWVPNAEARVESGGHVTVACPR